jgi:hypothetical protein
MNMAEAFDAVLIISVTGVPGTVRYIIRTQVHHPKWSGSRVEEKPTGIGSIKMRINQIYGPLSQTRNRTKKEEY